MAALIVLFETSPAPEAVLAALRRGGITASAEPTGRAAGERPASRATLSLAGHGTRASLDLVGDALGDPRLGEAARNSAWADAGEAVARHRGHARLVDSDPERPSLDTMQALSQMAAGLLELPGALALYGELGGAITEAAAARARLRGLPTPPPLDLWVGVRSFDLADAQGRFLDTLGMAQLGLPDLEAYAGDGTAAMEVAAWLRNLGLYLVQEDARARLRHGDTLDGPDEQPWQTLEDVATVEPARPVLRFVPLARGSRG